MFLKFLFTIETATRCCFLLVMRPISTVTCLHTYSTLLTTLYMYVYTGLSRYFHMLPDCLCVCIYTCLYVCRISVSCCRHVPEVLVLTLRLLIRSSSSTATGTHRMTCRHRHELTALDRRTRQAALLSSSPCRQLTRDALLTGVM